MGPALAQWFASACRSVLNRRGAVVGVSGGVDSASVIALATLALGPDHVLAVSLPDRDSRPESAALAADLARRLGVSFLNIDITAALEALGCYERRDRAIASVVPNFDPEYDK